MEAAILSILVAVIYIIIMYIFGVTNKNTPTFTPGSFTSTLHTYGGSDRCYNNGKSVEKSSKKSAEYYKHSLEIHATYAERTLKAFLTNKIGFEFQKIIYTDTKGHFFIADFYIPSKNLIIELDGEYHNNMQQQQKDAWRTELLTSLGYKVLRFSNNQILQSKNLYWILDIIQNN